MTTYYVKTSTKVTIKDDDELAPSLPPLTFTRETTATEYFAGKTKAQGLLCPTACKGLLIAFSDSAGGTGTAAGEEAQMEIADGSYILIGGEEPEGNDISLTSTNTTGIFEYVIFGDKAS